jgi:hypothetical protein
VGEGNYATIQEEMNGRVAAGMFETYMNVTWTFADGTAVSDDAIMGNSVNNNYPMWFEVTLADTGEKVFESLLLPVGTQIDEMRLDRDLDAGTYPAVVTVHLQTEEGEAIDSNAAFNIQIIVRA